MVRVRSKSNARHPSHSPWIHASRIGHNPVILQIFESKPTKTKNYGVWLRYQSRTGYHNMFKEYRDLTLNGAIEQMYTEMASRHRVRSHQIHIIKTVTIKAADCKRANITQFHDSQIKFPVLRKCVLSSPTCMKLWS